MADCKILIIDDDTDDVEILAEAFQQSGVDAVHYVHSAMQAFMYLESVVHANLPKLIVTDLYLPGITGEELLNDLKRMDKYKHIHVVVLSSFKTPEQIVKYKELGAVDYLVKPSSYQDYLQVAEYIRSKAEL